MNAQKISQISDPIDARRIETRPITMTIVLTNAPITREINRSTNARSCTGNGPLTLPAEICRKGANKLRSNNPIEK